MFADYVENLLIKLFNTKVNRNYRKSIVNLQISRINLVKFLQSLGLKKGNKIRQQVDIPQWIKNDRDFSIACVRGLVDTDGCVYKHSYYVNKKLYQYKKLAFSTKSNPLRKSVTKIMQKNKLNPKIDCKGDIRLYNINDVNRYLEVFKSNNPKHLNRFYN